EGLGCVLRPDFIQLSYAMKKSPIRGGRSGSQWGQESHRVKVLLGAIEIGLEQATLLATARVLASFSTEDDDDVAAAVLPPPPPPPSGSALATTSPPATNAAAASERSCLEQRPPAAAASAASLPPADGGDNGDDVGGGGDDGGGEVSMPMLPPGLSVSIVVDLAAVSVALTEAGVNVAAVALSAAHCKVNAENVRVKTVISLGDLYVLNLLRPPPLRSPAVSFAGEGGRRGGAGGGGRDAEPVEHSAAGLIGDAARREHGVGGGGNHDALDHHVGDDGSPLAWAEPVLGRREGAVGPVLDVALVVVRCAAGGHAHTAGAESATA
ncbi:unnamed protein product, partial [Ectocarpus sp. 12 AP-2014]